MGDINNLDVSWRSLLLFGFVVPLLLVALQLWLKPQEQKASRALALFLLLFGVNMVPQIIGFSGFYQVWPGLTFAPFNNELWLGPLLYLHLHALLLSTPWGRRKWLLLPGALQSLYYLICFVSFEDYRAKWSFSDSFHGPYVLPVETALTVIVSIFCLYRCVILTRRYKRYLQDTRSDGERFEPRWLNLFIALFAMLLGLWLMFEIVDRFISPMSYQSQYPVNLTLTLLISWMGLSALSRIQDPYPKMSDSPTPAPERKMDSGEEGQNWVDFGQLLQTRLQQEQWFLDPRFSLEQLAARMATNQSYVSRGLNSGLGLNFNSFINRARVKHAAGLMKDTQGRELLDIAFASGFNSKASFNRAFKEMTAQTPTQYRKSLTSQIQKKGENTEIAA